MKNLILANETGFCYGVRDAIKALAEKSKNLESHEKIQSLGFIIHNKEAIKEIEEAYPIETIQSLEEVQSNYVAIRAHGAGPQVYQALKEKNVEIIDTTCPFVLKTQKIGLELLKENYFIVILGKKNHPEVISIQQHLDKNCLVIQDEKDLHLLPKRKKIGIIFQSTVTVKDFSSILVEIIKDSSEVKIKPTICGVTTRRQIEIENLAKKVDYMIIVGGLNSSNTKKLFQLSQKLVESIQIEDPQQIFDINFSTFENIGLISGTSTSSSILEKIITNIKIRIPNIEVKNNV